MPRSPAGASPSSPSCPGSIPSTTGSRTGARDSTSGWTLAGGAKRAAGNEPFYVNSTADSFSLALPAGSTATSLWTCVAIDGFVARLFAVSSNALGTLEVDLLYKTSKGKVRTIGGISAIDGLVHTSWAPTLPVVIALDTLVRDLLVLDVNATEVAFRFRASSGLLTSASWRIDDLYVDPSVDKLGW